MVSAIKIKIATVYCSNKNIQPLLLIIALKDQNESTKEWRLIYFILRWSEVEASQICPRKPLLPTI